MREDNDATSDYELQSSDSEDDAQSDSLEMGDFIEHSCRMRYSTEHVKDSGIFPGGWGGGVCVIIFWEFGGGSELICNC